MFYSINKFNIKFEKSSRGAVLSSQDQCITYNASYLIMVLYSSLKIKPTQSSALWGLVLSYVLGTCKLLRLEIRKMKQS